MKAVSKLPWKKIGYICLCVAMGIVSAFFLITLYQSNQLFFDNLTIDAVITAKVLELATTIFAYAMVIIIAVMSVVSFVMRQKKAVNKGLIWGSGILSVLGMVFFMVFAKLNGMFEIGFENANLYVLYFLISVFATALPLFSAIRNLVKIKHSPVTFAKAERNTVKDKSVEEEPAAETESL